MSDLRGRNKPERIRLGSSTKIIGAIVVALGFFAIGVYTYDTGVRAPQHRQVVANNQVPSQTPPH